MLDSSLGTFLSYSEDVQMVPHDRRQVTTPIHLRAPHCLTSSQGRSLTLDQEGKKEAIGAIVAIGGQSVSSSLVTEQSSRGQMVGRLQN